MNPTNPTSNLFSDTYDESRQKFIDALPVIQTKFPNAVHHAHALANDPSVSIDWITAEPAQKQKLFILTTGQHGIEGYTGTAIQQLFIRDYLPRFDSKTTGLLLVHAINPWGMKYRRKVNGGNVDLNRNFNMHPAEFDPKSNPAARKLEKMVYPRSPANAGWFNRWWFFMRVLWNVMRIGQKDFMAGSLMGQYCYPDGMFYGGAEPQEETRLMMELYQSTLQTYPQVLHLDMHTGYGPRYQMSLVNSTREPASSAELICPLQIPTGAKDRCRRILQHTRRHDRLHAPSQSSEISTSSAFIAPPLNLAPTADRSLPVSAACERWSLRCRHVVSECKVKPPKSGSKNSSMSSMMCANRAGWKKPSLTRARLLMAFLRRRNIYQNNHPNPCQTG